MEILVASLVAGPLLAGGLLVALPRPVWARRLLVLGIPVAVLVTGAVLLGRTRDGSVVGVDVGGWPPGLAIPLVADTFGLLMVLVSALLALLCTAFAIAVGDDRRPHFPPLVLVMLAGANGAFLTADLFNLFVLIEVMLAPSYVLLNLTGDRRARTATPVYVTVNLLASTLLLGGIGLVYGVTGTVNLAELAGAAAGSPLTALAGGLVMLALAVKAAVVPVHGWLPRTYPYAPASVTALFSGLLTKVGVYALFRIYSVLYDGDPAFLWIIMVVALVTMVVGVLGAVGEDSMRSVLSFHMVSQIGYVLIGLALFTSTALSAAIFYMVQYILVKAALFLCAGAVEVGFGSGRLADLGGVAAREPLLAVAFAGAAFSLAGLPPFSGFVAKFVLVRAALGAEAYLAAALAIAVGLVTLLSMLKLWNGVFWGERPGPAGVGQSAPATTRVRPAIITPALVLAVATLVLGLGAEGLLVLSDVAAAGLADPSAYVREVLAR
jgi:multicomponent Na+:H+ antiporter subunit D